MSAWRDRKLCSSWLLAVCCLALASAGCGEGQEPKAGSPAPAPPASAPATSEPTATATPVLRDALNLVVITMDTTRADALGAYGQALPTTPNIDRLARDGVLFEHVATAAPETLPSHSTIFTGKMPFAHGARANAGYILSDRNVTLAELLGSHGYATGVEIAAPVLRKETQVTQGFDHYRGTESPGVTLKSVDHPKGPNLQEYRPMRIGADITAGGIEFVNGEYLDHVQFAKLRSDLTERLP